IPVVMDTNDRGMLDIERFDLEPERPILHGRIPELEAMSTAELIDKLENLSLQEKIYFLSQIIGIENVSDAMKLSLSQMNKSIVGWPQLASAVTLGGAMVTDACRKILLQQSSESGRYFVDFDTLIAQHAQQPSRVKSACSRSEPFRRQTIRRLAKNLSWVIKSCSKSLVSVRSHPIVRIGWMMKIPRLFWWKTTKPKLSTAVRECRSFPKSIRSRSRKLSESMTWASMKWFRRITETAELVNCADCGIPARWRAWVSEAIFCRVLGRQSHLNCRSKVYLC